MGDFGTGDAHANPFTRENIYAVCLSFRPRHPRQVQHDVRPPGKDTSLVAPNTLEHPSGPRSCGEDGALRHGHTRRVRRAEQADERGVDVHSSTMKSALGMRTVPAVRHGRARRQQATAWQQPDRTRHQAVRDRPQELPVQRHAARRRGLCQHMIDRGHSQDERPEPAQVHAVASRGDVKRRRSR